MRCSRHRGRPFLLSLFLVAAIATLVAATPLVAEQPKPTRTADLFRPADNRPLLSKAQMEKFGIRVFESKRLRLFTDIDPESAKPLPDLIDQAFGHWEDYFGKLAPDADGRKFQVNGYLIGEKKRFEEAGLLRNDLPDKFHGRQIGYEFWMMDQPRDYYRRHLLLHEATHTFMRAIPNHDLPLGYLEGMAEHFGTHKLSADGELTLRVVPHNRADFRGHDRMFLIRRDVTKRKTDELDLPTIRDVGSWGPANFEFFNDSYAWSWGVCLFFDQHPRTRDRFHATARSLSDPQAWPKFLESLKTDWAEVTTEWNVFASEAWEGFDFDRMAIDFRDGQPLPESNRNQKPLRFEVTADKGWQSSGVLLEKGKSYQLTATGQFTLADKLGDQDKPWICEADGISFRYHATRPLGRLLAAIRSPRTIDDPDERESMLDVMSLGSNAKFEAARSGTLYLRLNDHPGELSDNRGKVTVEIRQIDSEQNP